MKNQKLIQLVSDLAIPVLGFYFWDWNLYFILLFFCLDMIGGEVILYLKAKKIKEVQVDSQTKYWKSFQFISFLLLALNLVFIHLGMYAYHPDFNIWKEVLAFLNYKEMGIQQGYVLIPLIGLMVYTQYKATFLLPGKQFLIPFKGLYKRSFRLKFSVLIFTVLVSLLASTVQASEAVLLWVILIPVSIVNWLNNEDF